MKTFFVVAVLAAVTLAGCAAEEEGPEPAGNQDTTPAAPKTQGHGSFDGYLTSDDLPVATEGETLPDDNSTPIVWKRPAYRTLPSELTSLDPITHVEGTTGGNGIAVFGPLAFVGPTGGPMKIIDIMNPEMPKVLATAQAPARDIDTILYPDGTLIVVSTAGGRQMTFTDVTDPRNPEIVSVIDTPHSNHNLAVVPGTPFVYNSPSSGAFTDIINATNPLAPTIVKEWENGAGCHDMTFYMNITENKYRGYCAGLSVVQIWDVADVENPTIVQEIGWPGLYGAGSASIVTFAHLAMVNHDASILILGDETGGGAAPGCDVYANAGGTTVSGPLGNLYFYDITNEKAPVLGGQVSPNAFDAAGTCTAHFGQAIEDTNHLAMAFYSHGVLLVDFTDYRNPVIKDSFQDGNVWDVQYYQGYLFTGNIATGMDVLTLA